MAQNFYMRLVICYLNLGSEKLVRIFSFSNKILKVESKLSWSYDGQSFLPNITYNTSAFSPLFYIAVVF